MNDTMKKQYDVKKNPSHRRYIFAVISILLLIAASLVFIYFKQEQKSDPDSEKMIREAAARQLRKDPNELTESDFAQIKELSFSIHRRIEDLPYQLSDIRMLKKFTSLQKLNLDMIDLRYKEIPKWMKILAKAGILDLNKKYAIDLSPLKKLPDLQELTLGGTSVVNIKPLASLNNLKMLNFMSASITNIEPLRNLTQLHWLLIQSTQISDIKPLKYLVNLTRLEIRNTPLSDFKPIQMLKNLEKLELDNTHVSDLNFLTGLDNLNKLNLSNTQVSDLEPLKKLKNLSLLYIVDCPNITDEQIEDLQKTLPNLSIRR